jgi:hypothetical protein
MAARTRRPPGWTFKANVGHTVQFYGQLLIDEFILHQILHYSDGYWANKQGIQLGFKYINAFAVKNLDLQFETNIVRPFSYQHDDSIDNYSHYNQPLAHPLGANFAEFIAIARYQPTYKWNLEGKIIYYKQGLDSAGVNFGSNIFENYNTRPRDYGFQIGSGIPANVREYFRDCCPISGRKISFSNYPPCTGAIPSTILRILIIVPIPPPLRPEGSLGHQYVQ